MSENLKGPIGICGLSPEETEKCRIKEEDEKRQELEYISREGADALTIIDEYKVIKRWRLNSLYALDDLRSLFNLPVYHTGINGPPGRVYVCYFRLSEIKKFEREHKDLLKRVKRSIFSRFFN